MIQYIIQVAAFQLVFLMIYDAFLKKETFFNWNRIYLLSTAMLSVVIPFIRLEVFKNTIPQQYIINLPEVLIGKANANQNVIELETVIIESKPFWTWENLLYLGILMATLLFFIKIIKVLYMLVKNPKSKFGNLLIISLLNSNAAFSFFHYVFLGERLNESDKDAILKHEMVHVEQKHTLDLLFFEVMRILFWFNPLVYMYQNRIMTLHEFIADQEAVKNQDKTHYYQNLLAQVFQTQNISFINPFFKQSLIKKRIVMLQKSKSKQVNLLKYALLIPIVFGMLVYTSSYGQEKDKIEQNKSQDLDQYTYRVLVRDIKDEQLMAKAKELRQEYRAFLIENPEYVGWAQGDFKSGMTYSIHSIKEKVPKNLEKVSASYNGSPYTMFIESAIAGKEIIEVEEDVEVPFAVIENVPTFPGCEDLSSNDEIKKCTSDKISDHVNKNFNTELATKLNLYGRQRINVLFKIDKEGNVVDVSSRAPHSALEEEAIRVIKTLPKMQPGKQKGKLVTVPYSLPIIFQVADDKKAETPPPPPPPPPLSESEVGKIQIEKIENEVMALDEVAIVGYADQSSEDFEIPFAVIEHVPVFPGCENLDSNAEQRKCMSDKIAEHVNRNFNTKIATENNLEGRQSINVLFKIDTEGNIVGVKSRASHPSLEEEAIRVIKTLPKIQPGKQKGKSVTVPYSLPIIFQVQDDTPELEKK